MKIKFSIGGLVLLVLVVLITGQGCWYAEYAGEPVDDVTDNVSVEDENGKLNYEPEILEEFNIRDRVPIIVKLHYPNITKTEGVLATLSQRDFKLKGKFVNGPGFFGNITKEGFDILVDNPDVKMIYLDGLSYITDASATKYNPTILEYYKKLDLLPVTILMEDEIDINGFLSPPNEKKFKFNRKLQYTNGFEANISKEYLKELANDPDVIRIIIQEPLNVDGIVLPYKLNVLIMSFNGLQKEDLIASGYLEQEKGDYERNEKFYNYFLEDMSNINKELKELNISIKYWGSNFININVDFNDDYSNEKKKILLREIITKFTLRWYVSGVGHSVSGGVES